MLTGLKVDNGLPGWSRDLAHGEVYAAGAAQGLRQERQSDFIRVPYGDVRGVYRYLDMGVRGLIFPHVASVTDAKDAVKACLFPPVGLRGSTTLSRATEYGALVVPEEDYQSANERVWVLPVIEDVEGISALEEILALPGIRGFFVGPGDFAQSRLAAGAGSLPSVRSMVSWGSGADGSQSYSAFLRIKALTAASVQAISSWV